MKLFSGEVLGIPKNAFDDLDLALADNEGDPPVLKETFLPPSPQLTQTSSLFPMFSQPGSLPDFEEKVQAQKVSLETAFMAGPSTICGVVRVLNISFHKTVKVKCTVDDWCTVTETACEYMEGMSSSNMDKFSFKLVAANLAVGSRLQFCIKYACDGAEHWDSSGGSNYGFQVLNLI